MGEAAKAVVASAAAVLWCRASMDFAADLGGALGKLGQAVGGKVAELDLQADLDRRMAQVEAALQGFAPRLEVRDGFAPPDYSAAVTA